MREAAGQSAVVTALAKSSTSCAPLVLASHADTVAAI